MAGSVRQAKLKDMADILSMSAIFWMTTDYEEPFDNETASHYLRLSIEQGLFSVLEISGRLEGMAGGLMAPLLGNGNVLAGQEICFWINPEHRNNGNATQLLRHLEESAKEAGVKYWTMVAIESSSPERVGRLYEAAGYRKTETNYLKAL